MLATIPAPKTDDAGTDAQTVSAANRSGKHGKRGNDNREQRRRAVPWSAILAHRRLIEELQERCANAEDKFDVFSDLVLELCKRVRMLEAQRPPPPPDPELLTKKPLGLAVVAVEPIE